MRGLIWSRSRGEQACCNDFLVSTFSEDNRRWLDSWTQGGTCGDTLCGEHQGREQACASSHAPVYLSGIWAVSIPRLGTDFFLYINYGPHCVIRWGSGLLPPVTVPQCPMTDIQVPQGHTRAQASLGASALVPTHRTRLGEYRGGWGAPGPLRAALFTCCRLPVSDATGRLRLHKSGSWSSSGSSLGVPVRPGLS